MSKKSRANKAEQQTVEQDAGNLVAEAQKRLAKLPTAEARLKAEQATVEEMRRGIRQLEYYIPAVLSDAGEVPNPASQFHRLGMVHNDGSCWLLSEGLVERLDFSELTAFWDSWKVGGEKWLAWNERATADGRTKDILTQGVRYRLNRLHPDELEANYQWAWDRLAERIRFVHGSLVERIADAAARLDKAREALDNMVVEGKDVSQADYERLLVVRENNVKQAIKDAVERLEGAIDAAEAFDATERLDDLFRGLMLAIRSEAAALNAERAARNAPQLEVLSVVGQDEPAPEPEAVPA